MIRIILFLALIIHLPLSAQRVHSTQSSLESIELQTTIYISNLEKRRKELAIQREAELDIRRFKEMRLYRSSFYRDMLVKNRDRL